MKACHSYYVMNGGGNKNMIYINTFAIIGGDNRQIEMAKSILSDGYNICTVGFENAELLNKTIKKTSLDDAIKNSKYIILPLPATIKNNYLNAPYSKEKIKIDDTFAQKMHGKKVFCGIAKKLILTSEIWKDIDLCDYSKREEFAVNNAVPTAEGALEIALHEFNGTINGSKCLIAGFGRIGKVLSKMLNAIGAKVTVSARKPEDLAWINLLGYESILTSELAARDNFDIIFNTIPELIFDAQALAKTAQQSIIIDLASLPGGVDFEAAERLKINAIRALALPGKVAPKASGEIIKNTIYNMIEEG